MHHAGHVDTVSECPDVFGRDSEESTHRLDGRISLDIFVRLGAQQASPERTYLLGCEPRHEKPLVIGVHVESVGRNLVAFRLHFFAPRQNLRLHLFGSHVRLPLRVGDKLLAKLRPDGVERMSARTNAIEAIDELDDIPVTHAEPKR